MAAGSWPLAMALFEKGDAQFLDELRRIHSPDLLGGFAPKWIGDKRPFARRTLLEYLSRPLNAFRHEALVKRLFKLAEKTNDDEVMGAFLVTLDRTVRRERKQRTVTRQGEFGTRAEAEEAVRLWKLDGYSYTHIYNYSVRRVHSAYARKTVPALVPRGGTVMPRLPQTVKNPTLSDWQRNDYERQFQLFSQPTRRYLRRRAWRYFRLVGKADPKRFVKAATVYLTKYTDKDADTDIHLIDNWGLTHTLFGNSGVIDCPAKGWEFVDGYTIADLEPAPRFEAAWADDAQAVFDVMTGAQCRAVRQWAVWMLRQHHKDWLATQGTVATFLKLADHPDPDLSGLGFDLLERAADLASVPVEEWLARLDGDDLERLQRLSSLLARRLDPERVSLENAVKLAVYRSKPVAELGLTLLKKRSLKGVDAAVLLPLVQAESSAVRPDVVAWLRKQLERSGQVRAEWLTEFLDSKHADVRAVGWAWLTESQLKDDPAIWHRLIESPYDDIRGPLIEALAQRADGADADTVRLLWATVLLNVVRGGRHKPGVVARVVARILTKPEEAEQLLPLLAVAVRSLRGPEFRTGLAGVVAMVEHKPDLLPVVRQRFPELVV
jgi:hypothetical protein